MSSLDWARGPAPAGDNAGRLPLLALFGGDIITVDEAAPRATALLALGERIVAVGDDSTVRGAFAALRDLPVVGETTTIDLQGRAVVPGLIDSHLHLLWYGFFLQQVDLNDVTSIAALKAKIADAAAKAAPGDWIQGGGWQQDAFAERRMPDRYDLDMVAPDHPVFLHRVCYHAVVVNSKALAIAGINAQTPDPPGGVIDRDPASGEPTGILREHAVNLVADCIPTPTAAQATAALKLACSRAAAAGLTSVHTNDGPGDALNAYLGLRKAGELTLRVYFDTTIEPDNDAALNLPAGLGDDWVRVGAVKMFTDGSLGARTAWLSAPYYDNPNTAGMPVFSQAQINEMVLQAHTHGRQVAIHAIGDRAVQMALDAIAEALQRQPRTGHRHRIVHAQVIRADLLQRCVDLGVVVDIQPKFVTGELKWVPDRLGPSRLDYAYCWRKMLMAGLHCAGGSDCPVEPLEPLWGIYAAVTRSGMDGDPPGGWLPDERLDPLTALKLFTLDAAYGAFEEDRKGSLTPGKLADLVVLDRAPDKVLPHSIKDLRVELTVVGGRVVYRSE
jgi:hypothetical protein